MKSLQTTLILLVLITSAATCRLAMADLNSAFAAVGRGDYKTAFVEFKPLADQGNARAQTYLGFMYGTGEGVPEDDAQAVKWFRLAADQGVAEAQYNLGLMYFKSKGVLEDFVHAYAWWNIAVTQGHELARKNKTEVAEKMTPVRSTKLRS
jgi:TPR repeat protein